MKTRGYEKQAFLVSKGRVSPWFLLKDVLGLFEFNGTGKEMLLLVMSDVKAAHNIWP